MNWKIGDKLVIKSGGPVMEVIGFSRNGNVWCEWKDLDGLIQEGSFAPTRLEMAS